MTDPAARAAYPRRTVRVAAALVAGQAALCAVIGWVTFGTPDAAPPSAARPADPPAARSIVVPTVSMALPVPAAPAATTTAGTATTRPKAPTRAPKPPRPATTPPRARTTSVPVPPTTPATPVFTAEPTAAPPAADVGATAAPTSPEVQKPVVVGEPCDPPGASGRTADDVDVRCVRGDDGPPRWQIN